MLLMFHLLMASESPGDIDLPRNHIIFYIVGLTLLGAIFTSASFNELNNKSSALHYLSIPASTLEKLVSKWLVTGIIYVIAFNVFYFLFTVLSNILTTALFGVSAPTFNPFEKQVQLDLMSPFFISKLYLALHTTYLAGAVCFRKYAYFKTIIAHTFITLIMVGLISIVASVIFSSFIGENLANVRITQEGWLFKSFGDLLPTIGKLLLWVVLPLWMLTYSYFKLKETEV